MATSPRSGNAFADDTFLHQLRQTIVGLVSEKDQADLSSRQMGVLLTVYLTDPEGGHTVRGLAALLNVSKPAITRALDRLQDFNFTQRKVDPNDRRSVLVQKTPQGGAYMRRIQKASQPQETSTRKGSRKAAAA
jgi:DNA-binding MarR family transcriptional regulator